MREFIEQGRIKGLLICVECSGGGEDKGFVMASNEELIKETHTGNIMV